MLTVLQRAELVTRMAVEVERYIVELGTEGRLIEMQLEETMVGVAADKAALVRDYSVEDTEESLAHVARRRSPRCRTRTCSTSAASPSCSATTARSNTLDFPVSPRGYRVLGRIPRLPRLVVQKIVHEFGGLDEMLAATRRRARGGRGRGRRPARRTSARAFAGFRRSTSSTATCRPDGRVERPSRRKEAHIPETAVEDGRGARATSRTSGRSACDFEVGDNVVYPHHGAGVVLKKETKDLMGEKREYLTIKILHNDMTVMVPCENAHRAGLRRVIDEEQVKKVIDVLTDEVSEMPKNWNRRFKHNREKIKTGDVYELAEVVRNLAIRE